MVASTAGLESEVAQAAAVGVVKRTSGADANIVEFISDRSHETDVVLVGAGLGGGCFQKDDSGWRGVLAALSVGAVDDQQHVMPDCACAGLCCAALLAKSGKRVTVCESHYIAGGAAHGFDVKGFHFDAGPSFFAGLSGAAHSCCPSSLDVPHTLLAKLLRPVLKVPQMSCGSYAA